jgi:hypothetical protein
MCKLPEKSQNDVDYHGQQEAQKQHRNEREENDVTLFPDYDVARQFPERNVKPSRKNEDDSQDNQDTADKEDCLSDSLHLLCHLLLQLSSSSASSSRSCMKSFSGSLTPR